MPTKRNYKQERRTAKKRGETGVGSKSGDARRHRDRRAHEKRNGKIPAGKELDHSGRNGTGDTRVISRKANRSDGGKKGDKKGKAAGGRKARRT
jgi:hypothetical protein